MADEELERTYVIPLRKEYMKVPKYKRAKKAMTAVKQFLVKHMKSDNFKIGRHINLEIWKDGIKNPPHHIKITAIKDKEGVVRAELFGHKFEEKKKETKKEPETLKEKLVEKLGGSSKKEDKKEKPVDKVENKKPSKVVEEKVIPKKEEPKKAEVKSEKK